MSNIDFHALANPAISKLIPYQPGKTTEALKRELGLSVQLKLASNENLFGPSPSIYEAAYAALEKVHIYPDSGAFELKQALANFLHVKEEQITIGNGSENILELIVKAYLQKNYNAIVSQYAFLTIPNLILGQNAKLKTVPAKDWAHDVSGMIQAIDKNTRIIFIVNPNNPTGTYIPDADFRHFMENIPSHILVVVDEAYAEYVSVADYPHTLDYLEKYPNLIITRTFSKAYGLAALRLGYAISSSTIADILNRARLPFNVNAIALSTALAALKDQAHLKNTVALTHQGIKQIQSELINIGLKFIPSHGNFVAIEIINAISLYQKLIGEGIIVRPLDAYQMPQHIRVTIAPREQNQQFLSALQKVL